MQEANAPEPMLVTHCGTVTPVRLVLPANTSEPMLVTVCMLVSSFCDLMRESLHAVQVVFRGKVAEFLKYLFYARFLEERPVLI